MLLETVRRHQIKTVVLDVRGTVLSPWDDAPLIPELQTLLGACLEQGINLVLASATSLASTGLGFVIEPLLAEFHQRHINDERITGCLAYIESGTVAYRFNPEQRVVPLENYEVLVFDKDEKALVEQVLTETAAALGKPDLKYKFKPGQVNCYFGGPWPDRRQIADEMNVQFKARGFSRLLAQVPSARETIDIAVCTKARIAKDYLSRTGIKPEEVLIVGDSLQVGGNDEPLSLCMPGSVAVQVGETQPAGHIFQASLGPQGVVEAVQALLSSRKENVGLL